VSYPPHLHELESEVMDELWARGEGTVRDVLEALNGRGEPKRAYTTILTVMQRLHAKDVLRRERRGRHDAYLPVLTREQYEESRARLQVGELVSEYGDVALAHFARHMSGLDPARREQIQRLARGGD
jgi:BlaI family transcriptional regulator, penicillinase repressor